MTAVEKTITITGVEEKGVNITPGYRLANGAIVIAASVRSAHEWVILAMWPDGVNHTYATWKCRRPGDGSDTYWGHYFGDLREAVLDFYGRL